MDEWNFVVADDCGQIFAWFKTIEEAEICAEELRKQYNTNRIFARHKR